MEIANIPEIGVSGFAIIVLGIQRLTLMINSEELPFGIGDTIRWYLGVQTFETYYELETVQKLDGDDGVIMPETNYMVVMEQLPSALQPTNLARGLTCSYCASFILCLVSFIVIHFGYGKELVYTLFPFALSSIVIFCDLLTKKLEG